MSRREFRKEQKGRASNVGVDAFRGRHEPTNLHDEQDRQERNHCRATPWVASMTVTIVSGGTESSSSGMTANPLARWIDDSAPDDCDPVSLACHPGPSPADEDVSAGWRMTRRKSRRPTLEESGSSIRARIVGRSSTVRPIIAQRAGRTSISNTTADDTGLPGSPKNSFPPSTTPNACG